MSPLSLYVKLIVRFLVNTGFTLFFLSNYFLKKHHGKVGYIILYGTEYVIPINLA